MALAVGLTGRDYYTQHITPGGELRRHPRPGLRPRALGGAGRLLAVDDQPPRSPGWSPRRRSPTSTATATARAVWRGVADEFQRNLKAWTLTTNGPLEREPVLHPALEDRRPERGDHLQRRQRRPDARPARRSSTPASSSTRGSGCCPPTTRTSCARCAIVDATIKRTHRHRRRLPPLQRRRLRRPVDRRPPVGAVQPGQRPRLAGAGGRARAVGGRAAATSAPRSRAPAGDGAAWPPASG